MLRIVKFSWIYPVFIKREWIWYLLSNIAWFLISKIKNKLLQFIWFLYQKFNMINNIWLIILDKLHNLFFKNLYDVWALWLIIMIFKNAVSALLSRSIMCYFFSKYNRTGIFNQSEIKNFQNKIYAKFQKICRGRKKLTEIKENFKNFRTSRTVPESGMWNMLCPPHKDRSLCMAIGFLFYL